MDAAPVLVLEADMEELEALEPVLELELEAMELVLEKLEPVLEE